MELQNKRLPNGIHITESDWKSGPGIEGMPVSEDENSSIKRTAAENDIPWGYILIHNKQVEPFRKQVDAYNLSHPEDGHKCFVHYSYKYKQKEHGRGFIKKQMPTINGLVFLQGISSDLQTFLRNNYPQYHLINNCSTGKPAIIENRVMQPFMQAVNTHPENVTFLRDPFEKFAKDHIKLRVLTGIFKGLEGYIVRIDRDRQLVMEFGGYAVAIRGVHREDFEVVE